jgi:hypothetical protein
MSVAMLLLSDFDIFDAFVAGCSTKYCVLFNTR